MKKDTQQAVEDTAQQITAQQIASICGTGNKDAIRRVAAIISQMCAREREECETRAEIAAQQANTRGLSVDLIAMGILSGNDAIDALTYSALRVKIVAAIRNERRQAFDDVKALENRLAALEQGAASEIKAAAAEQDRLRAKLTELERAPLCAAHAEMWYCERPNIKTESGCIQCDAENRLVAAHVKIAQLELEREAYVTALQKTEALEKKVAALERTDLCGGVLCDAKSHLAQANAQIAQMCAEHNETKARLKAAMYLVCAQHKAMQGDGPDMG